MALGHSPPLRESHLLLIRQFSMSGIFDCFQTLQESVYLSTFLSAFRSRADLFLPEVEAVIAKCLFCSFGAGADVRHSN